MPSAATPSPRRATRTSLRDRLRARAGSEDGFTLIEVIVSALIVILISVGVAQGLIAGAHMSGYQQHKSQADEIAQQDQERLRGLSAKQLANLVTAETYTVTLSGEKYTVTSQASLLSTSGTTACTTSGSGAVAYYRTVSTVSWGEVSGNTTVTEDSVITPPISGALLVQVADQTGAALPGATVSAVGQSGVDNESGTTDSNGCVILTGLTADTYNLSITDTGYVDENGNTTLTDTATVTDSGTARPTNTTEVMGPAGTVTANFSTVAYTTDTGTTPGTLSSASSPAAPQYADDLSWYGQGGTQQMSTDSTVAGASTGSATLTASNLFPFYFAGPPGNYTNNYHVWAGNCLQEEPPSGYDTATVLPSSSQTMTVQEPGLLLYVSYNNGTTTTRISPAHVKLYFASSTGTTCSDTWTEQIRSTAATSTNGVLAYPGVPYATTTTTGSTASASGLKGTLSTCVDYNVGGSTGYRSTTANIASGLSMTAPNTMSLTITKTGSPSASGTCP
jgi:Tfp pilus assembly protein PilV